MAFVLDWDKAGEHYYETGISRGVLYVLSKTEGTNRYGTGVEWNGLTSVSESPEGAEVSSIYADNMKYLNLQSAEDFKGTIEAYTYPDEFGVCDGSANLLTGVKIGQQKRKMFGLCYRTEVGTDQETASQLGGKYKLHLVYNCLASPSERSYETINDSPEAITFSWEFSTTPVTVAGHSATAVVTIDSEELGSTNLATLEAVLYGTNDQTTISTISAKISGFTGAPMLLLPDEIVTLLSA